MHPSSWRPSLLALLAILGTAVTAAELKPTPDVPPTWKEFWASVRVEPAPPKNFLEGPFTGRVDNLTQGKISDETARKWALANLRRGRGDVYAGQHLRDDIADAGIFGPPGLNGTREQIQSMRAKNIDHLEMAGHLDMLAVGVIAVPEQVQRENPHLALTDFVIVQLYRSCVPDDSELGQLCGQVRP